MLYSGGSMLYDISAGDTAGTIGMKCGMNILICCHS